MRKFLALGVSMIAACAVVSRQQVVVPEPEPKAPEWTVSGELKGYPRDAFVIGLGRGVCQEAADDAARGEIAKVFEVRITEATDQSTTYSEVETGRGESWQRSADVARAVRTEASRVLAGVEIVARHRGQEGFVSLAALSRAKASDELYSRAVSLALRAEQLGKRTERDPLAAARAYYQAMLALVRLDVVNRDLRVLGLRKPVEVGLRASDLRAAFLEKLRSDVPFSLEVSGDDAARLQTAITSAFTALGVQISTGGKGRILVKGSCSMRRSDRLPREWIFVRYDLELRAQDAMTGAVLASVGPVSDDASGQTEAQAFERAGYVIRTKHVEPFVRTVMERLFGTGEEDH